MTRRWVSPASGLKAKTLSEVAQGKPGKSGHGGPGPCTIEQAWNKGFKDGLKRICSTNCYVLDACARAYMEGRIEGMRQSERPRKPGTGMGRRK